MNHLKCLLCEGVCFQKYVRSISLADKNTPEIRLQKVCQYVDWAQYLITRYLQDKRYRDNYKCFMVIVRVIQYCRVASVSNVSNYMLFHWNFKKF